MQGEQNKKKNSKKMKLANLINNGKKMKQVTSEI